MQRMNGLHPPVDPDALPRLVSPALERRLRVMPAVVVTGARQTGKSTLVRRLAGQQGERPGGGERRYLTLDDPDVWSAAGREPDLLVRGPQPTTIDEVQREPRLLQAIKQAIDERRAPGRFLLTGSANLLLMRQVSESLAGRASYLTLWPMTRAEQRGAGACGLWDELLSAPPAEWIDLLRAAGREREDWRALARRGGYPPAALHLADADDRAIWFEGYVRTYLERDLQSLANIALLPDYRRLMRAVSLRVGQLLNQTGLGRDIGLSQSTVHRYLSLMETSYLLVRLPAFAVSRNKRLMKTPKAYWSDTGLALHLSEQHEPGGEHLENLVLQDLLAWRDARLRPATLCYWRTSNGEEVDFVIEAGDRLLPIEVKSARRARLRDARHLHLFIDEYQDRSLPGLLLHDGERPEWITERVLAAPWWMVI